MENIFVEILQDISPELAMLFDEIDILSILSMPRLKKSAGFTFILPDPEKVRQYNNDKDHDITSVYMAMQNYFLIPYMPSAGVWQSNKGIITNLLGRQVEFKTLTRQSIVFSNGCQISFYKNYENIKCSIYTLVSGDMPSGGNRIKLTQEVTSNQLKSSVPDPRPFIKEQLFVRTPDHRMVCADWVGLFMKYLRDNFPFVFSGLIPLLDYCPVTSFIIIFEVGKKKDFLIENQIIQDFLYETKIKATGRHYFYSILENIKKFEPGCQAYRLPAETANEINKVRDDIIDERIPINIAKKLEAFYSSIVSGDFQCFPKETLQLFRSPDHKLVQDEMRYEIHALIEEGSTTLQLLNESIQLYRVLPRFTCKDTREMQTLSGFVTAFVQFATTTYFAYIFPTVPGMFGGKPSNFSDINIELEIVYDLVSPKYNDFKDKLEDLSEVLSNIDLSEDFMNNIKSRKK